MDSSHNRFPILAIGLVFLIVVTALAYFVWQKGLIKPKDSQTLTLIPGLSLNCPLPTSFCQGRDLYKESSLSAVLKGDTPLYAAFAGTVEGFPQEDFTLLSLSSQELKLQAVYYFKGPAVPRKTVEKGELIATANGQPINSMGGKSFVFVLLKQDGSSDLQPPPIPTNRR